MGEARRRRSRHRRRRRSRLVDQLGGSTEQLAEPLDNLQETESWLLSSQPLEHTEVGIGGNLPALEAYEAGRADGLRSAKVIARALGNENKELRAALERVIDLLVAVEESRRHGFVTSSVLQVEEVLAFARSLLMAQPSDWMEDPEGRWWPQTLTDDQAEAVALRFATTSDGPPSIGLVKAWYSAILASLPLLRSEDAAR